jgi:enterochelin esterase-like enzyme
MMQSPVGQQLVQKMASGNWLWALLIAGGCMIAGGCSETSEPPSQSGAPSEMVRERLPVVASSGAGEGQGTAAAGEQREAMRDEGTDPNLELAPNQPAEAAASEPAGSTPKEPAEPAANGPAEPGPSEPDEARMQLVPPIGQPGFPMGSAPRLVPMQFVGPISGLPVLFNIYLPPGYDSGTESYPVLYDLHGLTDSRDTDPGPVTGSLEAAMRNRVIGPLIVVFPQGFAEGYWADSRDHVRPSETQMIRELIPYVDGNFRSLAQRERRGVSGFSMGGFGAFAYATKYPQLFSVGIGYDSALDTWQTLVARRAYIATAAFADDESYFDQISPWANAERNAAALIASSKLRGVSGSQYRDFNAAFRDHLASLGIPYDYVETDCDHYYGCPIDREGQNSWALIQRVFSQPASAAAP